MSSEQCKQIWNVYFSSEPELCWFFLPSLADFRVCRFPWVQYVNIWDHIQNPPWIQIRVRQRRRRHETWSRNTEVALILWRYRGSSRQTWAITWSHRVCHTVRFLLFSHFYLNTKIQMKIQIPVSPCLDSDNAESFPNRHTDSLKIICTYTAYNSK